MLHPAAREMGGEKMRGVSTQGLGGSGEKEPIVLVVLARRCCWQVVVKENQEDT
jgi:hypothetical protein